MVYVLTIALVYQAFTFQHPTGLVALGPFLLYRWSAIVVCILSLVVTIFCHEILSVG
jgi:heme exporter protein D